MRHIVGKLSENGKTCRKRDFNEIDFSYLVLNPNYLRFFFIRDLKNFLAKFQHISKRFYQVLHFLFWI